MWYDVIGSAAHSYGCDPHKNLRDILVERAPPLAVGALSHLTNHERVV